MKDFDLTPFISIGSRMQQSNPGSKIRHGSNREQDSFYEIMVDPIEGLGFIKLYQCSLTVDFMIARTKYGLI